MEKNMRNIFLTQNNHEYIALHQAYYFWRVIDSLHTSNKADIYKHLYLTPTHFDDSFLKISLTFGVSLRTLERYRKEFVFSFVVISSLLKEFKDFSTVV